MKTYQLILGLLLITSCSTVQTRNDRAVRRIIADSTLTEFVGRLWAEANPCTTDTSFTGDSTYAEVDIPAYALVYDTADTRFRVRVDSTGHWSEFVYWGDTLKHNPTSGWVKVLRENARAKVKVPVAYVTDTRALRLARDTIEALVTQMDFLINNIMVRDSMHKQAQMEAARRRVESEIACQKALLEAKSGKWLVIVSPALAFIAGYFGWRQFRKKSPQKSQ